MKSMLAALSLTCLLATGCAVCASPYDDAYSAFGGKWERDQDHGRVASAFSPAGFRVDDQDVAPTDAPIDPAIEVDENDANESGGELRTIAYEQLLFGDDEEDPQTESAEDAEEEVGDGGGEMQQPNDV